MGKEGSWLAWEVEEGGAWIPCNASSRGWVENGVRLLREGGVKGCGFFPQGDSDCRGIASQRRKPGCMHLAARVGWGAHGSSRRSCAAPDRKAKVGQLHGPTICQQQIATGSFDSKHMHALGLRAPRSAALKRAFEPSAKVKWVDWMTGVPNLCRDGSSKHKLI